MRSSFSQIAQSLWRTSLGWLNRQVRGSGRSGFVLQVFENVRNHCRILDAGDHFDLAAITFTNFHVNIEHPFEPLHPCHRQMALLMALVKTIVIGRFSLLWLLVLATFGGRYLNTMLAIRPEDTVEAGEIDSRPRRQSRKPGNKIQRSKEDMGGAVRVRGFQLVSNLSMGRYRQTFL